MGVLRVGQMDVAEKLLSNYYPIDGCFDSWADWELGKNWLGI